jgi:trimethylamine---corrinoid protein Co-methyltransferase
MITSNATHNQSVHMRILSDDQIFEIKQAAYEVLEKTWYRVIHPGALKMLKAAGCRVKEDMVRVPRHIVQEALRTAPKGISIYDRQGDPCLRVEGRNSYYGTSTASPNTRDAVTGEVHETRLEDIARGALVADALENIDWVMPMGSAQDIPGMAADVHEFQAVVTNTTKPVVFIGYSPRGSELVFEMAASVAGGMDELRDKPFVLLYPEPITPMVYPEDVTARVLLAADLGMPQIPGPSQQLGGTAPMTMAGAVVQGLVEGFMSLVLAQVRRPGCPCFLSANFSALDMSYGTLIMGAPEKSLGLVAHAEVAQSFGLPTWGLAGATDSKLLDAQAGLEASFHILAQGLGGLNMIHDVGYMDHGMACSVHQMVMGNEIIGMARRFVRGVTVNADTLAREVIQKVGAGGNYLPEEHTYRHFRSESTMTKLLDHQDRASWQASGAKDMYTRVHEQVQSILANHKPAPLTDDVLAKLERIKQDGSQELQQLYGDR